MNATIEIEVTPPGPPGTRPWWTVRWDGTSARVRTAPGLNGDHPADWGIRCTSPDYATPPTEAPAHRASPENHVFVVTCPQTGPQPLTGWILVPTTPEFSPCDKIRREGFFGNTVSMSVVGYAPVSIAEGCQNLDRLPGALNAMGCGRVF